MTMAQVKTMLARYTRGAFFVEATTVPIVVKPMARVLTNYIGSACPRALTVAIRATTGARLNVEVVNRFKRCAFKVAIAPNSARSLIWKSGDKKVCKRGSS